MVSLVVGIIFILLSIMYYKYVVVHQTDILMLVYAITCFILGNFWLMVSYIT